MQIQNYLNRLSRPILERFDICVEAAPVSFLELEDQTMANEDSATIRSRVEKGSEDTKSSLPGNGYPQ